MPKLALRVVFALVGVVLTLVILGCANTGAPDGLLRGSGQEAAPPGGYVKLCREYPDFDGCTP